MIYGRTMVKKGRLKDKVFLLSLNVILLSVVYGSATRAESPPLESSTQGNEKESPSASEVSPPLDQAPSTRDLSDPDQSKAESSILRRSSGALLSLAPGLLVSGGGHWMIGRTQEAKKLFWLKLGSLGLLFGSGALVARSGASEYVTPWGIPLMLTSGMGFLSATILDLIGTLTDPSSTLTISHKHAPSVRSGEVMSLFTEGGVRETASQSTHGYWGLKWGHRIGQYSYRLSLSQADDQLRGQLGVERVVLIGESMAGWIRLNYTTHQNTRVSVEIHQAELTNHWLFKLGSLIGPSLKAMHAHFWVGWAGGFIQYPRDDLDGTSAILGGLTMTHHSFHDHLRVSGGYDHRHDGWVGGAIMQGVGSGVLGYFHTQAQIRIFDQYWVGAKASWGSAHMYTLNLGWGAGL